jgi:hypothetical protein
MFPVEIDTRKLNEVLHDLREALIGQGKDVSTILQDEHRRLTRTIVNFTPPIPSKGAQTIGEKAVRNDLKALISEAGPGLIDSIGAQYGLKDIDAWRTQKGGKTMRLLWDNLALNPAMLPELHNQYRNHLGRIPKMPNLGSGVWSSRIVVEKGRRDTYIAQVQSHVGRWKAKWAYGAAQLGDRYPAWITRHFGHIASKATFRPELTGDKPTITFGGSGPNFAQDKGKIQGAIKFRVKAITNRIKIVASGYAKEVAQGVRITTQAHKHNQPVEEIN